jgi:hypothetical protein
VNVLAALALAVLSVPPSSEPKPIPEGYTVLVDDTGLIAVAVPNAWTQVATAPVPNADGTPRAYIAAAPNLVSFLGTFADPGMQYTAFPFAPDPLVLLEQYGLRSGCESLEVREYEDPVFTGAIQIGTDCGPQEMMWRMVAANPESEAFTAVVQVQTTVEEEAENILLTFNVVDGATVPGSTLPGSAVPTIATAAPASTAPPVTTASG